MERRLLVVLAALAVAVVAVSLSAAATMSRGDSAEPTSDVQRMKSKPAKKTAARAPARSADGPGVTSSDNPQSVDEVESYWTKERMDDAQPMQKTRQGGSPSSSPAPSGSTAPGSAPTKKVTSREARHESHEAVPVGRRDVTARPTTSDPNYWTDDAMNDAQPLDNTRPGGTGSQDDPDPGGSSAPGSPPS